MSQDATRADGVAYYDEEQILISYYHQHYALSLHPISVLIFLYCSFNLLISFKAERGNGRIKWPRNQPIPY
jgi:hypothetical protein